MSECEPDKVVTIMRCSSCGGILKTKRVKKANGKFSKWSVVENTLAANCNGALESLPRADRGDE